MNTLPAALVGAITGLVIGWLVVAPLFSPAREIKVHEAWCPEPERECYMSIHDGRAWLQIPCMGTDRGAF